MIQAIRKGHYLLVRYYHAYRHVSLQCRDFLGNSPLQVAAENSRLKIMRWLLTQKECEVESSNFCGWTALFTAVFQGNVEAMDLLVESKCNVAHKDDYGCNVFILAASSPKIHVIETVPRTERKRRLKVHHDAFFQQMEFQEVHKLQGQHAAVTARGGKKKTQEDGDLNRTLNMWKYFPNRFELIVLTRLLKAVKQANKTAKGNRLSIDASDNKGRNALMYAGRFGYLYTVSRLLHAHAQIEAEDNYGQTALSYACRYEHLEVVEALISCQANLEHTDAHLDTPLQISIRGESETIVAVLIEARCDVNSFNAEWKTPIMSAMDKKNKRIFQLVLSAGPVLDVLDERGWNVLIYAVNNGLVEDLAPVLIALDEETLPVVRWRDPQGLTALHHAVMLSHLQYVKILHEIDPDVTIQDCNGNTPLHVAAEVGNLEIMDLLLENADDLDLLNNFGETPLHLACANCHMALVISLLNERKHFVAADCSICDCFGRSCLMRVVAGGHLDLCNLLALNKKGVNKHLSITDQKINDADDSGCTALMHAAREGQWQVIPTLVLACANLTSKDHDGLTALHWASFEGESICVSVLLDVKAEVNTPDFQGWTALMHGVAENNHQVCQILIDRNCDILTENQAGLTAMTMAAKNRAPPEVKDVLIEGMQSSMGCTGLTRKMTRENIDALGFYTLSVISMNDLNADGYDPWELNTYAYICFYPHLNGQPVSQFSNCVMGTSSPSFHESFRFESTKIDTAAFMFVLVCSAPTDDMKIWRASSRKTP